MAVVAVGDADPKALEALIRSTFGGIAPRKGARARTVAAVPAHDSTLISIATDKELSGSSVGVLWKSKGRMTRTVGDLRQDLLERLYDQM